MLIPGSGLSGNSGTLCRAMHDEERNRHFAAMHYRMDCGTRRSRWMS